MRRTIEQTQRANRDRGYNLVTMIAVGKMLHAYNLLIRNPRKHAVMWRHYPNTSLCTLCRIFYCSDTCPLFGRCPPRFISPCLSATAFHLHDRIQYFLEGADAHTGVDPKEQARAAARVSKAAKARRTWLVQRLGENGVTIKAAMAAWREAGESA